MAKKVQLKLNGRDIQRYVRQLARWRKGLDEDLDFFMRYIAQEAEDYAKSICPEGVIDHEGGHLKDSIKAAYNPSSKRITVRAGSAWAIYVEYGTGVVGAASPHPDPEGWSYGNRADGWWYPIDENVYEQMESLGMPVSKNADGQCFGWTKGMESRPFMYETQRYIRGLIEKEAKEFFTP